MKGIDMSDDKMVDNNNNNNTIAVEKIKENRIKRNIHNVFRKSRKSSDRQSAIGRPAVHNFHFRKNAVYNGLYSFHRNNSCCDAGRGMNQTGAQRSSLD